MNDDFLRGMSRPEVTAPLHQQQLKLTLLSTRKTAAMSVWLVAAPCFFLFCVLMKYFFGVNLHVLDTFFDMISELDRSPSGWWLNPLLFLVLPLLALATNLLAVMHVQLDKIQRELILTFKWQWANWLLIGISLLIIGLISTYLITENLIEGGSHKAKHETLKSSKL